MNIQEFRQKHPEYSDLSDQDLSEKLYSAFYSDIPKDAFVSKFLGQAQGAEPVAPTPVTKPDVQPATQDDIPVEGPVNPPSTTSLVQDRAPKEWYKKILPYVTAGLVNLDSTTRPDEVSTDPKTGKVIGINVPPSGTPGVFEDPAFLATTGLVAGGMRPAASLAQKAVQAGTEALGWVTGGASDVPALAKAAGKGAVQGAEAISRGVAAKNLEATMANAAAKADIGMGGAVRISENMVRPSAGGIKTVTKYYRGQQTDKPNDFYSMWVEGEPPLNYGKHIFETTDDFKNIIDSKQAKKLSVESIFKEYQNGNIPDFMSHIGTEGLTKKDFNDFLSPIETDNIISSAGWWDDRDFVRWFSEKFPKIKGIKTRDGLIIIGETPKFKRVDRELVEEYGNDAFNGIKEFTFGGEPILEKAVGNTPEALGEIYQNTPAPVPSVRPSGPPTNAQGIVRRSDLIKGLEEEFGVPTRIGRFPRGESKGVLGIYWPGKKVIRIRSANDIEVASHEYGHHIQDALGLSTVPEEIKKMAYPGAQNTEREGFAEFVRQYLTAPEAAKKNAPDFFKTFEEQTAKNPDIQKRFQDIQTGFDLWKQLPSKDKVASYIRSGTELKTKKLPTFDEIYTNVVDELHPIKRLTETAESLAGRPISPEESPFNRAWLSRGWARKADQFLRLGTFQETPKGPVFNGESLKDILKPIWEAGKPEDIGARLKEFDAYLVSRRAMADPRIIQGFKNQLSKADFRQTVVEDKAIFEPIARKLYAYQDTLLQNLVESGRLSSDAAKMMREKNLFYAPLYRIIEGADLAGAGGRKLSDLGMPIKRLKGSARDILSPTESIMRNTYLFTSLAEKNRVGASIAALADIPGIGPIIERVPQKMAPQRISVDEIKRKLLANPDDVEAQELLEQLGPELNDFVTIFRPSKALEKNEVVFYRKGEPEHYIIGDDELYGALTRLDGANLGLITKILSYPAKWLRTGATGSPSFLIRNPIRDQWSAFVMSKYGYVPGVDLVRGIFHVLKKDNIYQLYNSSGAAHAAQVSLDREYIAKGLDELLKENPQAKNLYNVFKQSPLKTLQALSEVMEEGSRVGEFAKGLKKEGINPAGLTKAGIAARDITMDFSRTGAKTKGINAIVAFWNARLQGLDKMGRQFADPKTRVKTLAKSVGGITIPTIALWYAQKDDPYYQALPNWQKTMFWNVIQHNDDGTLKRVITVPKPFELGAIFGTLPEMALNFAYNNDKTGIEDAVKNTLQGALPGVLPTAVTPWVENYFNHDIFFDRDIVPKEREGVYGELQYGPSTSETMKLAGKGVAKIPGMRDMASPAKMENVFNDYTGGLGRLALQGADKVLTGTGTIDRPPKPSAVEADYPFIQAFVGRFPGGSTKNVEDFYRELAKEEKAWDSRRAEMTAGERMVDVALSRRKLVRPPERLQELNQVADTLKQLRQAVELINESRAMTPEQKREKLTNIYYLMNNSASIALGREPISMKRKTP